MPPRIGKGRLGHFKPIPGPQKKKRDQTRQKASKNPAGRLCGLCREPGHYRATCPQAEPTEKLPKPARCQRCAEVGHTREECQATAG